MEVGENSDLYSMSSLGDVVILDCMCSSMGYDVDDCSYPHTELAP